MKQNAVPTLVGVFTSLLVIWLLHTFLVIDGCTQQGGVFNYDSAKCVLVDGTLYNPPLESLYLVLYFFVGFAVSFVVSGLIRKFFNIKQS